MSGPDTWESNRLQDDWLEYDGQTEYGLHPPAGRPILAMHAYISVDMAPGNFDPDAGGTAPASNWAEASGNLAEFRDPNGAYLAVKNDTCSDFFLWVVLELGPPAVTPQDSGVDAPMPAPPLDAASDGASDAAADAAAGG
jgi:hypothetical protein